jgi:hypothetical protein
MSAENTAYRDTIERDLNRNAHYPDCAKCGKPIEDHFTSGEPIALNAAHGNWLTPLFHMECAGEYAASLRIGAELAKTSPTAREVLERAS